VRYGKNFMQIPFWQWCVVCVFPAVALLYYGIPFRRFNIRQTGWLKPFYHRICMGWNSNGLSSHFL